jgi:hypothetical protein
MWLMRLKPAMDVLHPVFDYTGVRSGMAYHEELEID